MAKAAKKKAKPIKKSSRVSAKSKTARKSAKPIAKKKTAKPKIDPLNRKRYTSLSTVLTVGNIRRAVDFYTKAFGFNVRVMMEGPQGPMHAELRLRDGTLMLSPESHDNHNLSANTIGDTPATIYVLVENVDDVFNRALAAGGKILMPVADMFWGDRTAMVADPDGNKWMIATHKADPTEAEMRNAMQREMPQGGGAAATSAGSESEY